MPCTTSLCWSLRGLAEQKLSDDLLHDNGGLRQLDLISGLEISLVSTWLETDILFAEQAGCKDTRRSVGRQLVIARIYLHPDNGLIGTLIIIDGRHPAYAYTTGIDR